MNAPGRLWLRGHELSLQVIESSRQTLGIEVHPDSLDGARLVVRVPHGTAWPDVAPRVARRADWIARQVIHFEGFRPGPQPRQYVSGASFRLLGRQLVMQVERGNQVVRRVGTRLYVTTPDPKKRSAVSTAVARWYHAQAQAEFAWRLEQWLRHPLLQPAPPVRMQVRRLERRWGSLSAGGTLTLNTKLVEAPSLCIDYVIAHELCHHWHPDHGEAFWRLLADVLPDWQRRKHTLEQMTAP